MMAYRISLFFVKQKTAYEMRISDWSSDVCSSDLLTGLQAKYIAVSSDAGQYLSRRWRRRIPTMDMIEWEVVDKLMVNDVECAASVQIQERGDRKSVV